MSTTKGIVLAGGSGTRLFPLTLPVSKQLMPIYDKPLIYYPISTLMLAGIREMLIITTPRDHAAFEQLLGDGSQWGLSLSYAIQDEPKGIAEAFLIGKEFVGNNPVALILGDNIFHAEGLSNLLQTCSRNTSASNGATVFGYYVDDPSRYGVVSFDSNGKAVALVEKPKQWVSHYALTGLYFYDNQVVNIAQDLRPSARGELEITDLNAVYLEMGLLNVVKFSRGTAWLDTGTHDSLLDAANFIRIVEKRQGLKLACLEEIAFRLGYINEAELARAAETFEKSGYGQYLSKVLQGGR